MRKSVLLCIRKQIQDSSIQFCKAVKKPSKLRHNFVSLAALMPLATNMWQQPLKCGYKTCVLQRSILHSTKTSGNFKIGANSRDISWKSFQKILCANHSMENCRNSWKKIKWNGNSGKKSQKYLVYISLLLEVFLKILFCLATGNFQKFKSNFFVEWKAQLLIQML